MSCGSAELRGRRVYRYGSGPIQALVVSERNGQWGAAIEVPGSGALNTGGRAQVTSVSCASAGDCAAGGYYRDSSHRAQAFVVSERNGRWGKAIEVPGSGALNTGFGEGILANLQAYAERKSQKSPGTDVARAGHTSD